MLIPMRDALVAEEGSMYLELDPDGFALSNFPLNVHFVFAAPQGELRVRCWSETVILVTS
jgi:hypothetical protein